MSVNLRVVNCLRDWEAGVRGFESRTGPIQKFFTRPKGKRSQKVFPVGFFDTMTFFRKFISPFWVLSWGC